MNALEILKTWPGIEKANAGTLLSSSAWRLETEYAGHPATVRHGALASQTVDLDIALDGESHRLCIADSEAFPDLHLLWSRRQELPGSLLLALIEKECGPLFQAVENCVRKQLSVKGLADGETPANDMMSIVLTSNGVEIGFSLERSMGMTVEWGRIENLDVTHPALRKLERPVRAEYATYDLTDAEVSSLAPGGMLLMPGDALPSWRLPSAADDLVHVVSADEATVTFAQVADDDWPPVPPPEKLLIIARGRPYATAEMSTLGLTPAIKLISIL